MPADLTKDTIFAACDAHLFEHGAVPTYRDVREATGGSGSNSTLSRYIREWVATLPDRIRTTEQRPDVPEPVWQGVVTIWDEAVANARTAAQAELAGERAETAEAIDSARAERDAATAKADAETQRAAGLEARLTEADQARAEAQRAHAEQRDALATVRAELVSAQDLASQRQAEIERLRAEMATVRSEAATERAALTRSAEAETARWQRELDSARTAAAAAAKAADQRATALQASFQAAQEDLALQTRDVAALQANQVRITAATDELRAALAAKEKEAKTAGEGQSRLRDDLVAVRAERDALAQQVTDQGARIERWETRWAAMLERFTKQDQQGDSNGQKKSDA